MTTRPARDAGFTLIELLVVVVILGVIMVPLSNVVIGALSQQRSTHDRMALSHDAQISAAYFAQDVATVGVRDYSSAPPPSSSLPYLASVQLDAAFNAGGRVCGSATTPVAKVRFLADNWDDSVSPATVAVDVVAYYLAGSELHRAKCLAGSATPVSDVVLAHNVDPTTLVVTCSSQCDAVTVPQQVTLAFSVTAPTVGAYPITLNGQRRQS